MHNDIRITNLANATAKNILNNINIKDIEGIDILLKNNTNTKDLQEFNRLNQEYEHIKQNIKINNEKKQKFDELESLEKLEEDNKMVKSDISKLESDIISKEKELKKILEEIKELENLEYQNSISSLVNFQHEKLDPFHSPHFFGINLNPFDAFTTISCSENYKYANLIDNAIKEINKIGSQDSVWRLIEANFSLIKNKIENQIQETKLISNYKGQQDVSSFQDLKQKLLDTRNEAIKKELVILLTIDNKDVNNIVCEKLNPHSLDKINNIKELGSEYFEKYAYTMGKCCSEHGLVINCFQNFIQQHNEKVTQLQEKYKNSNINIETIKQQEVKLLSDINSSADRIKTLNMKLDTKTDFSKEIANIKKDLNNANLNNINASLTKLQNDSNDITNKMSNTKKAKDAYDKLYQIVRDDKSSKHLRLTKQNLFCTKVVDAIINILKEKENSQTPINTNNSKIKETQGSRIAFNNLNLKGEVNKNTINTNNADKLHKERQSTQKQIQSR